MYAASMAMAMAMAKIAGGLGRAVAMGSEVNICCHGVNRIYLGGTGLSGR